eukprot:TRINITY_DN1603_c0_g1_i1.p1 TRINITY_DN1603_c0_g1~~TRINITY_DN1603_c0_g1_i1.p1  ORF type:complete len:774 (-),score=240.20 TRINITY_DN1603_c0_g1_i1:248-2569(-)
MARRDNSQLFKPETALRRADELIQQDQKERALSSLHDVLSNKRYRVWQAALEDVAMKHVDLCVDLRATKYARDGLIQYRQVCQQVNVGSLEKVIAHFLEAAEGRAKDAQGGSAILEADLGDLDAEIIGDDSPESVLVKAVSGETLKDRAERESLQPWVKFLWEAYRTGLDVTRSNPRLETIYHDTARKAFDFCKRYKRKLEFRRLADLIRNHLAHQIKQSTPESKAALVGSQESFTKFIETRFRQLQAATALDLWQEAYRSIEDIHGVITFFKKKPPTKQMLEYFDKLMRVFWVSGNYLFHAHACMKYLSTASTAATTTTKGKPIALDEQLSATKVLLATLCIPFWDNANSLRNKEELFQYNINREKNTKITNLLGTSAIPTRASLIAEMVAKNTQRLVYPELQSLYADVEITFHPLEICHRINAAVNFIEQHADLRQYIEPLKKVAAVRMFEQICRVYDTMTAAELCKLCPYYSFAEMERLLVGVAKNRHNDMIISISHQTQSISFTDEPVDCDSLTAQLEALARKLEPVIGLCKAAAAPPKKPSNKLAKYFSAALEHIDDERSAVLDRIRVIEERREQQERSELQRIREAEEEQTKQKDLTRIREIERIRREQEMREAQQKKDAEKRAQLEQTQAMFKEVLQSSDVKVDAAIMSNKDKMLEISRKELLRQREEKEKKLKDEAKNLDYYERACREEERPLLVEQWKKRAEQDKDHHQKHEQEQKQQHREKWEHAIKEKRRLQRMEAHWNRFRDEVLSGPPAAAAQVADEAEE